MTTSSPSVSRLVWTPYEPEQINHKARSLVEANTRYDSNQALEHTSWHLTPMHVKPPKTGILMTACVLTLIAGYVAYRLIGA